MATPGGAKDATVIGTLEVAVGVGLGAKDATVTGTLEVAVGVGGGSDRSEKNTNKTGDWFRAGNVDWSYSDPENSSREHLLSGIPIKRVANLRAAESFVNTKGYAKVPKDLEKEYTRHWSSSECPPNKLRYLF